jgi:hypothetical protein
MKDPNMELLSTVVISVLDRLGADPGDGGAWDDLQSARALTKCDDPELASAAEAHDVDGLRALVEAWHSGKRHLPSCDREVLKRALKAFRKSLKVTRLAAESKLGGGPFSRGSDSQIVGIQPPPRYPMPVWMELVRQGRLVTDRRGTFELPPGE